MVVTKNMRWKRFSAFLSLERSISAAVVGPSGSEGTMLGHGIHLATSTALCGLGCISTDVDLYQYTG